MGKNHEQEIDQLGLPPKAREFLASIKAGLESRPTTEPEIKPEDVKVGVAIKETETGSGLVSIDFEHPRAFAIIPKDPDATATGMPWELASASKVMLTRDQAKKMLEVLTVALQ